MRRRSQADDVMAMLDEAKAEAGTGGVEQVETLARQGDAADAILDVAEEQRSDLIVVGNRGRGRGIAGARARSMVIAETQQKIVGKLMSLSGSTGLHKLLELL